MPSPIKLYNTLTRSVDPFTPLTPGKVRIYCCGPTVYDYQHVGNMRTYIFEDFLVRTLRYSGYDVTHVMNITDVGHLVSDADEGEDKMLLAARREKKSSMEIAEFYSKVFFEDCRKLNITPPNIVCKATDHIKEMISLTRRLERNGMTYVAGGNVYFDVSKLADYGRLARLDLEKLKAGARIEVDANKKNPLDFVLWFTKSKFEGQELQWESPWGKGYPGWHIECSAMSMKYLGEQFDIHCGGIDHVPVHHTNEIAQAEGATKKKPWVSVWMHGEFLVMEREKMSKSKGTFLTLDSITKEGIDPLAYRYFCLTAHYRTQLGFSWEALKHAANSLAKLRSAVLALKETSGDIAAGPVLSANKHIKEFEAAIFNDLNAPRALAALWAVLSDNVLSPGQRLLTLYKLDQVIGFGMPSWEEEAIAIPQNVARLVSLREEARKKKNWGESDKLRAEIRALGFLLEDSPGGAKIKKA